MKIQIFVLFLILSLINNYQFVSAVHNGEIIDSVSDSVENEGSNPSSEQLDSEVIRDDVRDTSIVDDDEDNGLYDFNQLLLNLGHNSEEDAQRICIGESHKKRSAPFINHYFYCKDSPSRLMSLREAKRTCVKQKSNGLFYCRKNTST
ncbi:uncharacterized protein LOC122502261 isoform X2 [Leptopilina heterotoma]|uniref:uncharacterized protein LOC122502261 isoform X2 n=1 Tax=Leptopilina heterotoma TaxID=63436 RepID=UPI001CA9A8DE|nr:uncharacterized protein LOC122502261 isoform X2 [Leptopilina heterotoma]